MAFPSGNRPNSGAGTNLRTVVVILVALALGAVVLKRGFGNDAVASDPGGVPTNSSTVGAAKTTIPKGGTTAPASAATTLPPTTTTIALNLALNKVLIANGAGIQGIAGTVSTLLTSRGYTVSLPATNAAATQPTSAVYFNPGADAVAKFVGLDLKIATVIAMPVTKPVKDRPEANVIVVLGQDFNVANVAPTQQLPLQTPAPAVPATPAAAVVQPTTTVKK